MTEGSKFATAWRTHTCGELRKEHVGSEVQMTGAMDKELEDNFFLLRDSHGITQVLLGEGGLDAASKQFDETAIDENNPQLDSILPPPESIVTIKGTVKERAEPDAENPSGEIYVEADDFEILSPANKPLLFDFRSKDLQKYDRIRFRYLYLRSQGMHEAMHFRTKLLRELRRSLVGQDFQEQETPLLANRWTPEAEHPFLAVRDPERIFALPGRRPIHGPLLATCGFDRTFEVQRRFCRKPKYEPMEQPEYSVLDIMQAYIDEDDVVQLIDELFVDVFEKVLDIKLDGEDAAKGAEEGEAKDDGEAKGDEDGEAKEGDAPAKEAGDAKGDADAKDEAKEGDAKGDADAKGKPKEGDAEEEEEPYVPRVLKLMTWEEFSEAGGKGEAKGDAEADEKGPELKHKLILVTRLPYFSFNEESKDWKVTGDPFARPIETELDDDPHQLHAYAFRLYLDGLQVGSACLRNHDMSVQRQLFETLGYDQDTVDANYNALIDVFKFGTPPHGCITLGLDRLAAVLLGRESIDEVIPMPKQDDGTDPLTRSPWPIDRGVARNLLGV